MYTIKVMVLTITCFLICCQTVIKHTFSSVFLSLTAALVYCRLYLPTISVSQLILERNIGCQHIATQMTPKSMRPFYVLHEHNIEQNSYMRVKVRYYDLESLVYHKECHYSYLNNIYLHIYLFSSIDLPPEDQVRGYKF